MDILDVILKLRPPYYWLGLITCFTCALSWTCLSLRSYLIIRKLPRAGKDPGFFLFGLAEAKHDFKKNAFRVIDEGYHKDKTIDKEQYKDYMFRVQTLNVERVILSPAYIEELNTKIPVESLGISEGISERLMGTYTNLEVVFKSNMHVEVCKGQLTQNLHKLVNPIHEVAGHWLQKRIEAKTEIVAQGLIVRIIAATASYMLGGPSASQDMAWLETAARYSHDVVATAQQLRQWPSFLRPFVAPTLDGKRKLEQHLATAKNTFQETFIQRFKQVSEGSETKSTDMVQWMVESATGQDRDPNILVQNLLFMTLAGIHTSSNTTVHALFDLCANLQYIEPLREEIKGVVDRDGWSLSALSKMKKLDSFIKESQRLNQTVLMTFNRRLLQSVRFSDGTVLPKGTYIAMPSVSVSRDPSIYDNPEEFDGMRFFNQRHSEKSQANRHQFATISPDSLVFGHGKTACPGRFFAGAQIKCVLAHIILYYDVSFPDGQTVRPKNLYKGGLIQPDPKQAIIFNPLI